MWRYEIIKCEFLTEAMELWLLWSLLACCLCHAGTSVPSPGSSTNSRDQGPIAEERHRILVVKKGRTAYLNPRVVLENSPSEGTCMIQVINNDPMTQRVGKLTPPVRNIFFLTISHKLYFTTLNCEIIFSAWRCKYSY